MSEGKASYSLQKLTFMVFEDINIFVTTVIIGHRTLFEIGKGGRSLILNKVHLVTDLAALEAFTIKTTHF